MSTKRSDMSETAYAEYSLVYRDERGEERERPLLEAVGLPFHGILPIRNPSAYRNQRHFSGGYWFSTTGALVPAESGMRRTALMLLDFESNVVAVAARPFRLICEARKNERGRRTRTAHVPDFFARLACGRGRVVDVIRSNGGTGRAGTRATVEIARAACREAGWEYVLMTDPEEPFLGNLRWLAGYRRRPLDPRFAEYAEAVIDACAGAAQPFDELAAVAGSPITTKPVIFHLLWRRVLDVDLHRPLTGRTLVSLGDGSPQEGVA